MKTILFASLLIVLHSTFAGNTIPKTECDINIDASESKDAGDWKVTVKCGEAKKEIFCKNEHKQFTLVSWIKEDKPE